VRRPNVIILAIAIVMGLFAAVLARNWLESRTGMADAQPTTSIVVATAPLAFGAPITPDKISEIPWAASALPQGAFATKQELLKDGRRVVLSSIDRNEPVLQSKVSAPGQRGALSSLLEEGKRAVTVRVDDVRGVAGFILPGDHVDVVLIRTESSGGQKYSDLILQNIKVLAVDQIVNERPDQASVVAKAVTLEVSPEQAQKVVLAIEIGRLSLVLQQVGGSGTTSQRITERDLGFEPAAPVVAAPGPVVPRRSESATVGIIRGTKREDYTVMRSN